MKKSQHMLKNLLSILLVFCVCTPGAYAAVDKPQLDISLGTLSSDGTNLSIDALVIAIITDVGGINIDPDEDFSLDAVLATGMGSLTAGDAGDPLLTATLSSFTLVNLGFGFGQFFADLSYTGGSMQGGLAGGRIEGAFQNADPASFAVSTPFTADTVIAKIGPVTVIPVPAAVWLFGSGLLGLIGIAKRNKAS